VYDGTADADIIGAALSGLISGDDVTLENATSGTFAQVGVGTGIMVSTSMSVSGTDAGNYSFIQPSGFSADITPKELTVSGVSAENKVYDGTRHASISGAVLNGIVSGDEVTLENTTSGTFAQADVGTSITVSTSMTLSGTDADNYSLHQLSSLSADIMPKELTVKADDKEREECASNPTFTLRYSGFAGNEDISVLNIKPVASCMADEGSTPGEYEITVTDGSADNYTMKYVSGLLTILPDATEPILSVKDTIISVHGSEKASISSEDLIESVSDNCGLADTSLSKSSFTSSDAGEVEVDVTVTDLNGNSTTKISLITVDVTNDIKNSDDKKVSIYPNPTSGVVKVDMNVEADRIMVMDITGKRVLNKEIVNRQNKFNLSGLSNGIYIIRIQTGKKWLNYKVIKE
jgi:hypothetical protein